jgi:hypothetical protein
MAVGSLGGGAMWGSRQGNLASSQGLIDKSIEPIFQLLPVDPVLVYQVAGVIDLKLVYDVVVLLAFSRLFSKPI